VICSTLYEQSDGNRQEDRSSQSEVTGRFVGRRHQGWSAPTEDDISDGERRLFDISSVPTSGVRDWVTEIETVMTSQHFVDGLSRLKTEVYEVVRAQLHGVARLQNLV